MKKKTNKKVKRAKKKVNNALNGYFASYVDGRPIEANHAIRFYTKLSSLKQDMEFAETFFASHRYHRVKDGKLDLDGKFITSLSDIKLDVRSRIKLKRDKAKPIKI